MRPDFEIPVAPDLLVDPQSMSIDEAIDRIFTEKGWPLLGGPSGEGWSKWETAQRCAHLFRVTFGPDGKRDANRKVLGGAVPAPLQIGALFHVLTALRAATDFAHEAHVMPDRGGLCAPAVRPRGRPRTWLPPQTAPEEFLYALKALCNATDEALESNLKESIAIEKKRKAGEAVVREAPRAPLLSIVLEAERIYDAHTRYWSACEDVTPLGIEFYVKARNLSYTCRYDMIGRVGDQDPFIPPGVYIFERKTARWLDEAYLEGWTIDGEILGEIYCWHNSDCEERFGKLSGVVMDVVSKGKIPECKRIVLPPDVSMAEKHARWIRMTQGNLALYSALNTFPQSFGNCHGRFGRCSEWSNCVTGLEPGGDR